MTSFIKALRRSSLKHKRLCEDWGDNRDPVQDGVTFFVKYVGSCLVHQAKGDRATAEAIKTIVSMAKMSGKKLDRVAFTVDPKSILVLEEPTKRLQLQVPIYRISYCSADAYYNNVFAFIAVNLNDTLECHAFLCPKKKIAHAVTLTIAQAFNIAYDVWQNGKEENLLQQKGESMGMQENLNTLLREDKSHINEDKNGEQQDLLIDFDDNVCSPNKPSLDAPWNLVNKFDWDSNFDKFIQDRYFIPRLETNLSPDNIDDLRQYIASHHDVNGRQCIFREDSCDLSSL
ncbi:hypothetical protein CHUAL_011415 [Chamberlinius hualienensis]